VTLNDHRNARKGVGEVVKTLLEGRAIPMRKRDCYWSTCTVKVMMTIRGNSGNGVFKVGR